jgi:hypothetical protein
MPPKRHGQAMRRFVTISLALCVLALGAATAAAADGSWGSWEPTSQGPVGIPAGAVCPFAVAAEPVHQNLAVRYHYDASGAIDAYEFKGSLLARITNLDTGASTERSLSGFGTVTPHPDGSYDAVFEGGLLLLLGGGDSPSSELLLLTGRTVLHGSPTGVKTVVAASGASEDLCQTLA